jgi:Flp pilus assembly protein TadD
MRISGSRICSWERLIFRQENYSEAVTELAKARELSGGSSEAIGMTGYAWALAGDFPKARAVLKELKALASQRYIPSTHLALLCYTLDEKDEAFAWLQKACDDRDVRLCCAKVDPRWNLMRSDARFIAMLKRMGLQ